MSSLAQSVKTKESTGTCSVCCENFTEKRRKRIGCAACDYEACNVCYKTFITSEGVSRPKCMQCNTKEQNVDKPNTDDVQLNESVPCYVCNKCGNTISSNLGGFTVHYMDSSNQENGTIECDNCCPLSPNTLKWIARYQEEEAASAAAAEEARRKEEDGYSSDDYYTEYDHSEEAS